LQAYAFAVGRDAAGLWGDGLSVAARSN